MRKLGRGGKLSIQYLAKQKQRVVTWLGRVSGPALVALRKFRASHSRGLRVATLFATASTLTAAIICVLVLSFGLHYIYFDRSGLPDIEPLINFEFPIDGHIYDVNGQPLIDLAK